MSTIQPLPQTFPLVKVNGLPGFYTPEFKTYLDAMLKRMFGIRGGVYTQLTDAPTIQWDVDLNPCAVVVLGGNRTLANPTNMVPGPLSLYRITVVQDGTGGRTMSWGSAYKFSGGVAPVITTAANAVDEYIFDCDGTNMKLVAGAKDLR